jgi:DNA-binding NarL/FixJ family response regulator
VPKAISILVVDDNPLVGESLARWFSRVGDFRFLGYVDDTSKIEEIVKDLHPDVVLLDLDMPGFDPVGIVSRLAAAHPTIFVTMLSAHMLPHAIRACLNAGACGYLSKDEDPAAIAAAVRRIKEGKRVLSPQAQAAIGTGPLGAII